MARALHVVFAVVLLITYYPNVASAAQITARKVVIGSSVASASTTYAFTFTVPSATIIKSVSMTACTTASNACTTPTGFSSGASTLSVQPVNLGDATGWTVDTSDAGALRITKSGNTTLPSGAQTVTFGSVTNPSATNATFFLRIATYSDAAWSVPIDNGVVAASTAGQVTVTAVVDEALIFTLADTAVNLGTLTTSTTGSGTSTMTVATNALSGYTVTYSGGTLESAGNTIPAISSPTASTPNSRQFGLNMRANTTPAVGTNVTGAGTGTPATNYNTVDEFMFNTAGDVIATATGPTNSNVYTTSYIANVDSLAPPGTYTTVITYVATANF